jgi:apolipoprotein N-acyltransferase
VPPFLAAGTLGLSQIDMPVLQLASVTGIAGVTALVVAANAALVGVVDHGRARTRRVAGLAGVAALVVVAATWGDRRIAAPPVAAGASGEVVLVDGGAQTVGESTLERYVDATPRTLDPPPALVVWPESALDVDLERDRSAWLRLAAFVDGLGVPLVTGGIATALDTGGEPMRFNAVHYVRPRHGVESYYKRWLMPLAEAWPAALGAPPSVLTPVTAGRQLALFGDGAWRFGPLICSEITDGAAARGLVRLGARFLVSVNNDVWFGDREAPHVVWARVRAVETGVPVARASNRGTSGVIDPFGRWVVRRGAGAPGWMQAELPPPVPALYVRTGDWFLPLCAVVVLVGLGRWRRST